MSKINNNNSNKNYNQKGGKTVTPFLISFKEERDYKDKFLNNGKVDITNNNKNKIMSPLSGSEPKYEPGKWNDNENVKFNHNCYAYVLDTIVHKRSGKPQPGYFTNFPPLKETDYQCNEFYKRLKKDIPSMYLISFDNKCKKGFYKGFIALDDKKEDTDYHFYRQDSSGYWSHKPGRQEAVNYDADKKKIVNPLTANRKYKYFNYHKPCFFFCLNKKLARSRSNYYGKGYNYGF